MRALQCVVVCRSMLQCVVFTVPRRIWRRREGGVLQCVAVCCSVLRVLMHVLHCVAVCCNMLYSLCGGELAVDARAV